MYLWLVGLTTLAGKQRLVDGTAIVLFSRNERTQLQALYWFAGQPLWPSCQINSWGWLIFTTLALRHRMVNGTASSPFIRIPHRHKPLTGGRGNLYGQLVERIGGIVGLYDIDIEIQTGALHGYQCIHQEGG